MTNSRNSLQSVVHYGYKLLIVFLFLTIKTYLYSQPKWYRGNTHAHTNNSDGILKPSDLVKRYEEVGYQFLFITDHNFVTPVDQYSSPGFICFNGEEITFSRHFNGLGIQHYIKPESGQKAIESVLAQNGFPTLNHPLWPPTRVYSKEILGLEKLTSIEIHNALTESWGFHDNQMLWDSLLTSGRLIYGLASDDAHSPNDIGKGWIMLHANELNRDTLMQAILKGHFYSSTGIVLTQIETTTKLINISSTNATRFRFIGEGGKILKTVAGNFGTYNLSGSEKYIRVEASNDLGAFAWT